MAPSSAAMVNPSLPIAFQGWPGAHSDMASRAVSPRHETLPCRSFEEAIAAVHEGRAAAALIPVENSVAGRVADVHHLLPDSGLYITGEYFHQVHHHLLAVRGSRLDDLKRVHSHVHALGQCRRLLRRHGLEPVVHADTAGAAKMVADAGEAADGAIASALAAELYGLDVLLEDVEDAAHNTTRFLVMEREARWPAPGDGRVVTSFVFQVRSVPAALYKALGGFATNGVNISKLESYLVGGRFSQAQFYADVEGHPDDRGLRFAFAELNYFARSGSVKVLGVYPAAPFREDPSQSEPEDD
jgi:prephenate dehydratase